MKTVLIAALAIATPGIAAGQSAAGATETAPTAAAGSAATTAVPGRTAIKDPSKTICRTRETLGSRLGGTRECHTRAEWFEINRQAGDDLNQRLRVPPSGSAGG